MDHQFYRPMPDRHSKHMENLSLIMGIIALSTFCLVYPALICGALGIVFALLSRGGETTFSGRAKLGLTLSSVALGIIVLVTGVVTGILTIVNGARLLKGKSDLMF